MEYVQRFLSIYIVVLAVLSFLLLVIGLGWGGLFASSLEQENFETMLEDGCLSYILGLAISAFFVTILIFLCSLTVK